MSNLLNVGEQNQISYCDFCCNSTVEPDLTVDNDLGYMSVGKTENGYGLYIKSGNGKPTVLAVSKWEKDLSCNSTIAIYKMKYCPECGRKLIENIF